VPAKTRKYDFVQPTAATTYARGENACMNLSVAPEIFGIGIIVVVAGSLAAVWYLRRKGYWEARTRQGHQ
jgi:hypothetical protein